MNGFQTQIIGIGLVMAGLLGLVLLDHSPFDVHVQKRESLSTKKQDENIDNHLKHTHFKHQLRAMAVDIENDEWVPKSHLEPLKELGGIDKTQWGVDLSQEGGANKISADLEREEREERGFEQTTLEQVILSEEAHREWLDKYDKIHKAEFIKGFLENARKEGYAIQLNDDLEVIGIEKIQIPKAIHIPEYIF